MIATYRLQLRPEFTFDDAAALLPYFQKLGVSHLYLSPITESRPGSTHGYDVVDHNEVRAELGGREGFNQLLQAARAAGLQLILDFVPNHAGVGPRNSYWQDVLAYGPHSPYARYFDIDWNPLKPELHGKILLPFLGTTYGEAFDNDQIQLTYDNGRFYASYYENRYELSPSTYAMLLETALPRYERTAPYWDLKDLLEAYRSLGPDEREKAEALRLRLMSMAERIDLEELPDFQGSPLHALLERQFWRLSYWKTAGYEINYRRFFDINGLVGLRMEDEHVFWDAHRLLGELLAQEGVAGVRIDHVDGLFDPHRYLDFLRALGAGQIWVEKILAHGETVPEAWPVQGTTGYEFMNDVMHLLLQPEGELPLDRTYRRFVPEAVSFEEEVYQSKQLVMRTTLSSELFRLAYELDRISEADYHTRDFTLEALREALAEVVAAFERYRTYLPYDEAEAREVVQHAVYKAQQRNPATEPTVYQFLARVILGEVREHLQETQRQWAGRFQQYTAPVAAKGVEDTAFYRYLRLAALCEVGGEPDRFGLPVQAFHSRARFRAHRYPHNLLTTATHDHKRGEDTRMRLIALTEVPDLWDETVSALAQVGEDHRAERVPCRWDEYLFYQLLAALWEPASSLSPSAAAQAEEAYHDALPDRLWDYMQKASRESKRYTSWINPDAGYEEGLEAFVRGVCADARTGEVIGTLAATLARHGFFNSLSQVVLKLTTPGVPDLYQGCELLDLSLVDPDNRRPVDYDLRRSLLDELEALLEAPEAEAVRQLVEAYDTRAKLYVTARLLRLRQAQPDLFRGAYRALEAGGPGAGHYVAYSREHEEAALVAVVPRFSASWKEAGDATFLLPDELAGHTWTEALTGTTLEGTTRIETAALPLPWAVLVRKEER